MIKDPHIRNLLKKHALNTCSKEEREELVNFFKTQGVKDIDSIPDVEEINELMGEDDFEMEEEASFHIYKDIIAHTKDQNNGSGAVKRFLRVAAIFVGFILVGTLYKMSHNSSNLEVDIEHIRQDKVTLQLENGEVKVIDINLTQDLTNEKGSIVGKQVRNSIAYSNKVEIETLTYNTLNIPYGQTFELLLSDGTVVHLNAGTSIKYPVKFLKGYSRDVFLEGEAYFDVAKDKKHRFVVNNKGVNVEVYGTKFNVSTYPEDEVTDVVLVEGSVSMYKTGEQVDSQEQAKVMLKPGIKGSFNKKDKAIETKPVITSIYTSWIHGELVFRDMTFENILKKLERRYNVSITIENKVFAQEVFNASFKDVPIEKVLEYLKITYNIDYTINNNYITIK
ncbi:FecR family protein [Aestuariivivens insulae]|uniref:FecR family protein n=1 Tax=Aestuariivivens insulae TaxID=1621988 RepID=UPI001F55E6E7|nr:FecR family protein [Aestuariivivens insulae]